MSAQFYRIVLSEAGFDVRVTHALLYFYGHPLWIYNFKKTAHNK